MSENFLKTIHKEKNKNCYVLKENNIEEMYLKVMNLKDLHIYSTGRYILFIFFYPSVVVEGGKKKKSYNHRSSFIHDMPLASSFHNFSYIHSIIYLFYITFYLVFMYDPE
jgi:hypothetical protein